jgi:zinc-binding alcohol dehydrogenase/oxidoreductase
MGSPQDFAAMLELFRKGLRPVVDRVFPLQDAASAMQHLANADQFGKVVLRID